MNDEQIEILVEEPSMKNFLVQLLPLILPDGYQLNSNCFIRDHEGKQHLRKEIPQKVRAYNHFNKTVRVIIIHDKDSADCKILKAEICKVINENANIPSLIRIACKELEAWYLGDMDALQSVYSVFKANKYKNWAKFRNPDNCNAFEELKQLIPEFQKGYASKEIVKYMNIGRNSSKSFKHLITGIQKFLQ